MKVRWLLLTVVVLSLVLTACGGGDSKDDPTAPVSDFLNALAKKDADKASNAVCKEYRADVKAGLEMIFGFMGEDGKIEISGLKLEARDKKDTEAMVYATAGKMKMSMMGTVEEQDLAGDQDPVKVIKEDGKWVVCDGEFTGGFAP